MGGVNFSTADNNAIKERFDLEKIKKTVAGNFRVKNGFVLFNRLLLFLTYGYFQRETYDYKPNYFVYDQSSLLERIYHTLEFALGYSFFKYSAKNNISFELGGGWVRKIHEFKTIANFTTISDLANATTGIPRSVNYDEGILSTTLKFYHRLRKESTLFLGIRYSLLVPSLEHFPDIFLGIALNLTLIAQPTDDPIQKDLEEVLEEEVEQKDEEENKANGENKNNEN